MEIIKEEVTAGEEVQSHEEEEGETRCVCGEIEPPDDSGLYIQCEQCSAWQHGACVGIADGEDSHVEKYWCEQCKPQLHHLYTVDTTGATRSIYKPVAEKKRTSRRSNRRTEGDLETPQLGADQSEDSVDTTHVSSSSSGRLHGSRGKKDSHAEGKLEVEYRVEGKIADPGPGSEDIEGADEAERRLQDRKRATFSAREEKQYQWMLEKAIRESRRTSQQEIEGKEGGENQDGETNSAVTAANAPMKGLEPTSLENTANDSVLRQEESASQVEGVSAGYGNEATAPAAGIASPPAQVIKATTGSGSRSSNSTSEDDGRRRAPSRRSQRVGNTAKRTNRNNRNSGEGTPNGRGRNNNASARGDIGIDKPMKPRIPPQRTSLNEMRRRVSAILEFISRTQWELSESHSSKDELVQFVENQQFIEQVDSIFEKYDHSFKLMDDLTRSLLLWEKKYSRSSSIQD